MTKTETNIDMDVVIREREAVSRSRRHAFVARVVSFCLGSALLLVALAGFELISSTPVVSTFVDAMVSLATAVALGYLGGSVIDYNGGIMPAIRGKSVEPAKSK